VPVVVAGEKIADIVPRERLRIAQSFRHEFHFGAVGIAAENRAAVGIVDDLTLARRHVRAGVGDGPVEPAIRADFRAVHVVPAVADVDAEA